MPEDARDLIAQRVRASAAAIEDVARQTDAIVAVAGAITAAMRRGNKLLLFGNGGSAADAQHIAAEFLGRYLMERAAMPAISLSDNSSTVTCVANDYAFERVFARQIEGLGQPGDVAFGITTSGGSENVIAGLRAARERGLETVALTGAGGTGLAELADHVVAVAADETPRIQEAHALVAHLICELVEREVAGAGDG
jgi:D-sedoheptulose 7-phosphate isomerase